MKKENKIYSFDIFDTLLLRPYTNPQEVWNILEEQENCKGFAKYRKEADEKTYATATREDRETTIEEAYSIMPHKYQALMKKEIELERKVLCANPEMLEKWEKAKSEGKKCILVSDMYLPQEIIEDILIEKGIRGWDALYLSRTYNARKTTGKLFKIMLKEQSLKPEDVIHIGDNIRSDVDIPNRLGIKTEHYKKISERFFSICPFARHIDQRLAGALALGYHQYSYKLKENGTTSTYWHQFGFNIGGVLGYTYVKWIVETARKLGYSRLLFVARDGYVWKKICEALYPDIETGYIYAPRVTSIALLGIIGSDPIAINDRKRYKERYLQNIDREEIELEYRKYINQFHIDEHTALVDGCSSGFSAQTLVEHTLGRSVFTFYEVAMAEMHNAAALIQTNLYCPQFMFLSEFLFGAPESPVIGIKDCKPVYNNNIPQEEKFKISLCDEIADAAVFCANILNNQKLSSPRFKDFCDTFMLFLSNEGKQMLEQAKDAGDIEQKCSTPVIYSPRNERFYISARCIGRFSTEIEINTKDKKRLITLSRTQYKHASKDYSIRYNVVCIK